MPEPDHAEPNSGEIDIVLPGGAKVRTSRTTVVAVLPLVALIGLAGAFGWLLLDYYREHMRAFSAGIAEQHAAQAKALQEIAATLRDGVENQQGQLYLLSQMLPPERRPSVMPPWNLQRLLPPPRWDFRGEVRQEDGK